MFVVALAMGVSACASGGPNADRDAGSGSLIAPGLDGGGGPSGECGVVGGPCCGGFCNTGLMCNPATDRCDATSCGAEGQDCCTEGTPCQGMLSCLVSGVCVQLGLVDAGPGGGGCGCGMRGAACCSTDPPCSAGLSCNGGTCQDAPACGAIGQACCAGDMCNTGLMCDAGMCRSTSMPMCTADGGRCSTNGDCCNNSCMSGVCQTAGSGMDPCPTYPSCGACTATPHCMWCAGGCTDYIPLGELVCAAFPEQC